MNIGLVDVDSKIPNLALMKLSAYHKAKGDIVKIYDPLFDKPDRVYASKIFKFTEDYNYFPDCEIIKHGSGYDLETKLPEEIEHAYPDYSFYNQPYATGFSSRGCSRNCGFCIVPRKEGPIHPVADIDEFWHGQSHLMLLDGNLTAEPDHFNRICQQLIKNKVKTYFSQGLDIRLMDEEKAKLLNKVKSWDNKRIRFAWDSMDIEDEVVSGIKKVTKYIKPHKIMFYVLIGWDTTPEEDLYRVELLKSYGTMPFVMPFNKFDNYQRHFARWVNMKSMFMKVPWVETDEYKKVLAGS